MQFVNKDLLRDEDHYAAKIKEHRRRCLHPGFKTHGQSYLKSETEGASGPIKWTYVQENYFKALNLIYFYSER